MFKLSYNTNGLRELPLARAIEEISKAGYDGVELSFHERHLHPFKLTKQDLKELKNIFSDNNITPVCIATGADKLLSNESYEPSLISLNKKDRMRRIDLMGKSIEIAAFLSIPVVNFASGLLKKDVSATQARDLLIESIKLCLRDAGDITLALEPEPNFFVSTTKEALSVINEIDSSHFKLNLDIGHVYCCEDDFFPALRRSITYTRHIHIEDIKNRHHHHEIPGDGEIDFSEVFMILKDSKYAHYVSVELYHHTSVWETALSRSYEYLKKITDSLDNEK